MASLPPHLFFKILVIVFIILAVWVLHPMIWQLFINSDKIKSQSKNIIITAHRGANKLAPENTISAIKKALDLGVEMVEIDVHLTKDRQLVVIHDETLDRTTNGSGKVADFTLEELQQLDAGSWFSQEHRGKQLPTLAEVLKLINGKATCLIEIKLSDGKPYSGIEERIIEEIVSNNAIEWCIVQSFESYYLENFNKQYPEIHLGKLLVGSWQFPLPFYIDHRFHWGSYSPLKYIDWVNFHFKRSTPSFINHLHSKGVKVGVYTPNAKGDIIKQFNMGVDCIITNETELALSLTGKD